MTIERRIYRAEWRDVPGSNGRQKWATAVTYGTVDDYGTLWRPGVFDEALAERMPTILYGHDWYDLNHVLGAGIDFRQTPAEVGPPGVDVLFEFADPDEVPSARLAMRLLDPNATSKGPVLRDVSVGFERREWMCRDALTAEQLAAGAEEEMIKAGMDELSLVVRGAVPGAQVRSRRGTIDLDAVVEIAKRKAAGDITDAEAAEAVKLLSGETPPPPKADPEPDAEAAAAEAARLAAEAAEAEQALVTDVDEALALVLGRSRR
jgi:hypothetical protein